ncbi:MAG: hypothetical protein OEU36_13630 [Gammaproteobacteria bacterium]|nr:hypothetical protein [Gammaproteobacteria bacterium]
MTDDKSHRHYFDVFGRQVLVEKRTDGWRAFYSNDDGKRRLATDIQIPVEITEAELERYLDDLCHEWSTARNPRVRRIG